MQTLTKTKQVNVSSNILVELITRVEELESLVETLEVSMDKDILKQVEDSKKDFAQGKFKTIRTKKELSDYLASFNVF